MLFGRNASAGLINIVTRVPGDDFEARANASLSGSERKLGAALSGPLVEGRVRLLGSVYKNERDGVLDNLFNGAELNNRSDEGGRLVLALLPNEQVDITLRADYSRSNQDCCIWTVRQFANASTDPRPLATSLPNPATWIGASLSPAFRSPFTSTFVPSLVAGPENRNVFLGGANFGEQTNDGLSAEINWALGDYTLTSLTARRSWSQLDNNDSDSTARPVLDRNGGGNELSQFSQELRIT